MSYTDAFSFISDFYVDKTKSRVASADFYPGSMRSMLFFCVKNYWSIGELIAVIADFPKLVVIALAHAIKHLQRFDIADAFVETKFFHKFTTRVHMLLNGNTLTNLLVKSDFL
jgi:DNA mismatch repair protein MSH3